jgi:aminoglycoside phosphotransferase (APT) family kinase protein
MEHLASGRASAVYALDEHRVLRRCAWDTAVEARVMRHVRERGYPVPEVFDARGGDMVMERLHGPTLAEATLAGRITPAAAAALLLDLHERLHAIAAPPWLATEARGVDLNGRNGSPAVLHLDLHLENVIVTGAGPQVIDWTNTAAGDPAIDRALSWIINAEVDTAALSLPDTAFQALLDALRPGLPEAAMASALRYRAADLGIDEAAHDRVRTRLHAKGTA